MTGGQWLLLALPAAFVAALIGRVVREFRANDRRRRALELDDAIEYAEQLSSRRRHPSTPVEDRPDWPPQ